MSVQNQIIRLADNQLYKDIHKYIEIQLLSTLKQDWVALLIADPSPTNSTTMHSTELQNVTNHVNRVNFLTYSVLLQIPFVVTFFNFFG